MVAPSQHVINGVSLLKSLGYAKMPVSHLMFSALHSFAVAVKGNRTKDGMPFVLENF